MKKQLFESKFSSGDPSGEYSSDSEGVDYAKKKSHCNEFASYFESDSSLSKIGVLTLGDSSSSDELLVDNVRPVDQILVLEQEEDDIEHLRKISEDDSTNIHGSCGR